MPGIKDENPFREWLSGRAFDGEWIPIAQHVAGGPQARPALVRAPNVAKVLELRGRLHFQLDGAGPDIWTRFDGGVEVHEAHLHPVTREGEVEYEPIVAKFDPRDRKGWIEPVQAFVLYWKAWPDRESDGSIVWRRQVDSGDLEEVVRWIPLPESPYCEGRMEVKRRCLLAFLAMFEFDLAICYDDHVRDEPGLLHGWVDEAVEENRSWIVRTVEVGSGARITTLNALCVIRRPPFDNTRQPWQIEDTSGVEYVVGVDAATGEPTKRAYEGEKDFLLPVFFREAVLERYYSDPSLYEVSEYEVQCEGQWYLRIARTERNTIHAWLGDVAALPIAVQKHWQQYSVVDDGVVPEWRIKTDLLAEWVDAPDARGVERLKQAIGALNVAAQARYAQPLYSAIDPMHKQSVAVLRIPANNSLAAFQEQLRTLAILLVDHINSALLDAAGVKKVEGEGTLNRLATLVATLRKVDLNIAKEQIGGLFAVQALRSNLVAHRSGSAAGKVLARAHITLRRLPQGFEDLVNGACDAIESIRKALEDDQ